jgi:hypothetical protein
MKTTKTPEEIAEGLSERLAVALSRATVFGAQRHTQDGRTSAALMRRGLVVERLIGYRPWQQRAWLQTDLGRAVADVLAKRGAR